MALMPAQGGSFSELLRRAAADKGLTQKQLALEFGKDQSTISLWLKGLRKPSDAETIHKLAGFLGLLPSNLRSLLTDTSPAVLLDDADFERELSALFSGSAPLPSHFTLAGAIRLVRAEGYELRDGEAIPNFERWLKTKLEAAPSPSLNALKTDTDLVEAFFSAWTRDRVRLNIRNLNQAFEQAAQARVASAAPPEISLVEFNRLIREGLTEGVADRLVEYIRGAQNASGRARRGLAQTRGDRVAARWRISPDLVLNRLGGYRTGIRGLDYLMDQGLLPQLGGGPCILIKGLYGRGKSTLALEVAAALAYQSQVVIYLAVEESSAAILERLSYIGYHRIASTETVFDVEHVLTTRNGPVARRFMLSDSNTVDVERIDDTLSNAAPERNGLLWLADLPGSSADLTNRSDTIVQALADLQKRWPTRYFTVVVDSLDAVAPGQDRRALERIMSQARQPRRSTIFICQDSEHSQIRDYLSDIVLQVDVRPRGGDQTERTIEITKGRTQNHLRGVHGLTIRAEEGVRIWPALPTYLAIQKNRYRDADVSTEASWRLGHLDLAAQLEHRFLARSSTILYGPHRTHKKPLALAFLATDIRPDSRRLFVSFNEDQTRILQIVTSYGSQLKSLAEADANTFQLLHQPPEFLFPERIVHWLRRYIRENGEFDRVVISGLNAFIAQSPPVGQEGLFVPALQAAFSDSMILFVESRPTVRDGLDLRNLCDYVLQLDEPEQDTGVVTLKMERGGSATTSAKSIRLVSRPEYPRSPSPFVLELAVEGPRRRRRS